MKRISIGRTLVWLALMAASGWGFSVSPARTDIRLAPGQKIKHTLTITNTNDEPFNVEMSEKSWFVLPDNKNIPVSDWLKLTGKTHFKLKPGESRKVHVLIQCPKQAVGELVGMVSFAYRTQKPGMLTPMISVSVYADVIGTEKKAGEIVAVGAGNRAGRFVVGVQVKSTGNVHLRPVGTVALKNDQTQQVTEYTVPEMEPVYPGLVRNYRANGPETAPPAGPYTISAVLHSGDLELKSEQRVRVDAQGDVVPLKDSKEGQQS